MVGTKRPPLPESATERDRVRVLPFDGTDLDVRLADEVEQATHLLLSVPPDEGGDRFLPHAADRLAASGDLVWIGYLSTTGVYGDRGGGSVDETSECRPTSERSRRRVRAEEQWLALGREHDLPVHVFRLAGIYGPGRNVVERLLEGERPRRIHKAGQVFNRIHVDDIVGALRASIDRPREGRIYNLSDDEPAPRHEVLDHACRLLGNDPEALLGPLVDFDEAKEELSSMARSFWSDSRRVSNRRVKDELGLSLRYPTYREGLRALAEGRSL